MPIESLLLGAGGLVVAANIATWCFAAQAKSERQYRREAVREERRERKRFVAEERFTRRQIERQTARRLAEEAYQRREEWLDMLGGCMDTVWEMRKDTRELRTQFENLVRTNKAFMKASPLTFQQREAIQDCIFHLETGIARLSAYSGPYLQRVVESIQEAKQAVLDDEFDEPLEFEATLPDDFPVVGEVLKLSESEAMQLLKSGEVDLGYEQVGRLKGTPPTLDVASGLIAFLESYDGNEGCWWLSLAKAAVATGGNTFHEMDGLEVKLTAPNKGGYTVIWHSPFAESLQFFLPFPLADRAFQSAPWGTRIKVFVHEADYSLRSIRVGSSPPPRPDDLGDAVAVEVASPEIRDILVSGFEKKPTTFWLADGVKGPGQANAGLRVRALTGEEFPVLLDEARNCLRIMPAVACRLGIAEGSICRSGVAFQFGDEDEAQPARASVSASDFARRITARLEEQEELQAVFREQALETRKYQLLLEGAIEAVRNLPPIVLNYTSYRLEAVTETNGAGEVVFTLEPGPTASVEGCIARLRAVNPEVSGSVRAYDRKGRTLSVSFKGDPYSRFVTEEISGCGTLECRAVPFDAERQSQALEQFQSVSFSSSRSLDDREAFRRLRKAMLGLPQALATSTAVDAKAFADSGLHPQQQLACGLINSDNPLTLILGPPGTGKTDTIARALIVYLQRNPQARVAIASQANVAVDEALKKLKERYPECDIVRHVSDRAAQSIMESSKELTQHARVEAFLKQLGEELPLPPWANSLREAFRGECKDNSFVTRRVLRGLMNSVSVLGCTLSILGRQSSGAALFDIVVVDEAAKASLPECMIAALAAKRLVLVGDHNQLLPFVDERVLEASGPTRKDRQEVEALWTNSLFKRLWVRAPNSCKVQLTAQYRSRSGIRDAISKLFYDKKLTPGRTDRSDLVPFTHSLVWVDTKGRAHDQVYSEKDRSLINRHEIGVVLGELRMLASSLSAPRATSVAIICFYGAQRDEMERAVRASALASAFRSCEVRTVDASQGGQWDIVLLSLTRCSGDSTFVGSANRLNVALSRARELAVVVGALRYALQDRNPESMLGQLARHIQTHAGQHVWLGGPTSRSGRSCR